MIDTAAAMTVAQCVHHLLATCFKTPMPFFALC